MTTVESSLAFAIVPDRSVAGIVADAVNGETPFPEMCPVSVVAPLPPLGTVTVASVPTAVTFDDPVNAGLVHVMSPVIPMVRPVASVVAVPALPETLVWSPVLLPDRLRPVMFPPAVMLPNDTTEPALAALETAMVVAEASPSVGVVRVAPSARTTEPVPVDVVAPVPPFATGSAVPEYEIAKVPETVMGDPVMDRNAGTEAATLVTVPPLVLLLLGGVAHVPSPRQ